MRINHKPVPGQPGFRCTFRHPKNKKVLTFGLGTQDATDAEASCRDLELIFADAKLLDDPRSPRLLAFKPRAVEIALQSTYGNEKGRELTAQLLQRQNKPLLDDVDIATLSGRIIQALNADRSKLSILDDILSQYESLRCAELQDDCRKLQNQVKVMQPLADELERIKKTQNLHVKVSIGDAVKAWKIWYADGHSQKTQNEAAAALVSFKSTLPGADAFKLGQVRALDIDKWLDDLRNSKDVKEKLSPVTKRKLRAYVSTFFTWAIKKYELSQNPLTNTMTVSGVARNPENIVAIRRLKDLDTFINGLKKYPYWQALAAVAVFAGPRFAEMCWLKIDDVYLDEGYIRITSRSSGKRITGTKTGRERNIAIESSTLKAILENHVATRKAEQKKKDANVNEKSDWLFPSTVTENIYKPRTKTPAGQWSDNGVFADAWAAVQKKVDDELNGKPKKGKEREPLPDFWSFGPKEWRHTFGTILGHCGWTSLEIARAMGNSPSVAERHYIAAGKGGERWPFKF